MPIEIRERFCIQAPVDAVWRFVMDPHRVVSCMPGAQLGRGMIQGISQQLFQQFTAALKERLEAKDGGRATPAAVSSPSPPLRLAALLFRVLLQRVLAFLRGLLRTS